MIGVGFLAGLLTVLSPCVLPVLPAVIASGVLSGGRRRAVAIAVGLALAFGLSALFSIRLLQALNLPLGLRYDIAIVVLLILAAMMILPRIGELVERLLAPLGRGRAPRTTGSGLLLGASLGLLYLPCGGPILATIAAVGDPSGTLGASAVALTAAYSIGIAAPMLGLILASGRASRATGWLRAHAVGTRRVGGVLLAGSALAIAFGSATALQTDIPGYSATIEHRLTDSRSVSGDLAKIGNPHESGEATRIQTSVHEPLLHTSGDPADPLQQVLVSSLHNYGTAPAFADVTAWLNTPDGKSLNLVSLRGKVVLIDFWTYSCINCLRSLPHVEAWYSRYHGAGLEVIGVHTPEFDFEHNVSNVRSAVARLGIHYPVAIDNDYGTWSAWGNDSWPAEYVIDAAGDVRYGSIGEGGYGETEGVIRALLAQHHHGSLPAPTSVPDATPMQALTPETYLGYARLARYVGTPIVRDRAQTYTVTSAPAVSHVSYGGRLTVQDEDVVVGTGGGQIAINVNAADVYLVLAGTGTVTATLDGKEVSSQHVSGVPTDYAVLSGTATRKGVLDIHLSPGLTAYDLTFG